LIVEVRQLVYQPLLLMPYLVDFHDAPLSFYRWYWHAERLNCSPRQKRNVRPPRGGAQIVSRSRLIQNPS
jgi:hypothetical protein